MKSENCLSASTSAKKEFPLRFAGTLVLSLLVTVCPAAVRHWNDGTDAIVGTFGRLPQGAVLSINGQAFSISYTGGTGNDVVLTRVNGPANRSGPVKLSSNSRGWAKSV